MPTKKRTTKPESRRDEQVRALLKKETLTRGEFEELCRLANVVADPETLRRSDAFGGAIPVAVAKDMLQRGAVHRMG